MEVWNEEVLPEGALLDQRYRILRVLGNGGFGIVIMLCNRFLILLSKSYSLFIFMSIHYLHFVAYI